MVVAVVSGSGHINTLYCADNDPIERVYLGRWALLIAGLSGELYCQEWRAGVDLSAQRAVRCIARIGEAYKRDKSKRPHDRPAAAIPAAIPREPCVMSLKGRDRVSLLTLSGRVIVPFIVGRYQSERFSVARRRWAPALGSIRLVYGIGLNRYNGGPLTMVIERVLPDDNANRYRHNRSRA